MRRSVLAGLVLSLAFLSSQVSVQAQDLTITVLPMDIYQNETTFITVMIQSTNPLIGVQSAGFDFRITQLSVSNPNSAIEFDANQPQDAPSTSAGSEYQNSYLTQSNYLFFNDSGALSVPTNIGNIDPLDPTHYSGGDSSNSGLDHFPSAGAVLIQLKLTANPTQGSAPSVGDKFSVELQSSAPGTLFQNQNGDTLTFNEFAGTVTVLAARAVPEPGSLALLAIGLGATWMMVRRKRQDRSTI